MGELLDGTMDYRRWRFAGEGRRRESSICELRVARSRGDGEGGWARVDVEEWR